MVLGCARKRGLARYIPWSTTIKILHVEFLGILSGTATAYFLEVFVFEEGMNPMTIMQLSGHSTLRMLERYARPGEDIRWDAIESLDTRRDRKGTVIDFHVQKG